MSLPFVSKYFIVKILNHNVVMAKDEDNREVIVFGKGIGFNKKNDDCIIDGFEKVYEIKNEKNREAYQELVSNADEEVLLASESIISKMIEKFGKQYNEKLHVSLLDHLIFSVKRYKEKLVIGNIFLEEIEYMYPREFAFSKEMVDLVNKILKINLPSSEIGFICMHIHSALNDSEAGLSNLVIRIIGDSVELIERETGISLCSTNVLKQRLVTHLKFALKRAIDGIELDNPIEGIIKSKYRKTYHLAEKLKDYIHDEYGILLNEGEVCYLTIHIQNILNQGG